METNIQEKAVSIIKKDENDKAITIQAGTSLFFDIAKFEHAQRVAKVFAASSMVPTQFQNNIPNCVIALNLSERMQVDPFMLMQNMYIVHGRPGIEAKLAIGLINQSGKFSELEYEMVGNPKDDTYGCKAYAEKLSTGKVLYGPKVDVAMAKAEGWYQKQGSKWQTMKELMLQYRAAMFFARTYCPDVLLGMLIREELQDIIDITPVSKKEKSKPKKEDYQPKEIKETSPIELFEKLTKKPLEEFEKEHRDEIQSWPKEARDAFNEKWESKMKQSYEAFLRQQSLINNEIKPSEEPQQKEPAPVKETSGGLGIVKCPQINEAVTFTYCKMAKCVPFKEKSCLARFPEQ